MTAGGPSILVVEDDPGISALEREIIEELGGEPLLVASGLAALELLRERTPTLMLLDYSLPDMSAIDLLTLLHGAGIPVPPFIATTGAGDEQVAVGLMKEGASDYLIKDARFPEILPQAIRRVLGEIGIARRLAAAEQEVARQIDRYNAILETTQDGFLILNLEGEILEANEAYCRMVGYGREALIGRSLNLVKPPGSDEVVRAIQAIVKRGALRVESVDIARDGVPVDVEVSAVYDPKQGVMAFVRDISERKRAERELERYRHHLETLVLERTGELEQAKARIEEAELKYRTVADHAYDWETWIDTDGRFLYCSPSCERITGYPAVEFTTDPDLLRRVVVTEDWDKVADHLACHLSEEGVHEMEFRIRRPDGEIRWVGHVCTPIHGLRGEFLGRRASNRDITERRQADQAIREAKEAAERANRAKSVFLANMSHELRTPLNAILGFAQILHREAGFGSTHRAELETIQRAGRHLLELINDVLEISRIEAGRTVSRSDPFDLIEIIADIESMMRVRAASKGLKFVVECAAGLPRHVLGDAHHLRQVLLNLLGNAVKFTPNGEVRLDVACRADGQVQFSVRDTGPGIDPEEHAQIFQPFYQTEVGVSLGEGAGLGLTISREFVQMMGGELRLACPPEGGSLFTFTLPLPAAATPAKAFPSGRVVGLAKGESGCHVLVAEDDPDSRALVVRLLSAVGLAVEGVENGRLAVERFRSWHPCLILMDMRMPELDGYEAVRQIRALPGGAEVRIVALTASAFDLDRAAILEAGCDEMVIKPLEADRLFDLLGRLLGLRFCHADEAEPTPPAPSPEREGDLRRLDGELRRSLADAAGSLDLDGTLSVCDRLRASHPEEAEDIERLVADFRFDRVIELCEAAEREGG